MSIRIGEVVSDIALQDAPSPQPEDRRATAPVIDEATIDLIVDRVLARLRREWER